MSLLKTPQPARHPAPLTKAQRLSHLVLARRDLEAAEKFFIHFGLAVAERRPGALFLRAADPHAYCIEVREAPNDDFIGFGLEVAGPADLDTLAALPGAERQTVWDRPGGGACVVLTDPGGHRIEAVTGQTPVEALAVRAPLGANRPGAPERINEGQRPAFEPPQILKLGHTVLMVSRFQEMSGWYTETFGLIPSDCDVLPDGSPAICFFRFDLGDVPADHHSIAMGQGFDDIHIHSAFEVCDLDAVGVGQAVLHKQGYDHAWGIGRHILGSQIFDYWRDPTGDMFEHYCDGDVFTADAPLGVQAAGSDTLFQWGPPVPGDFIRPKPNLKTLKALVRNVRKSPDLSVRKLVMMARTMG